MSSKSTFSNSTAKSYALALYELSKESSASNEVEKEMKSIQKLLNDATDFKEVVSNPMITKEEKKNVILKILEQNNFSEISKKFLGFVSNKNRLFFLEKIIKAYLSLVSISKGELQAKLISSKELSIEEQQKIKKEFSQNFKYSLNIDYKYEPDLIGGLIFQIGSVMIDTSIKTKLKKIEKNMLEVQYAN